MSVNLHDFERSGCIMKNKKWYRQNTKTVLNIMQGLLAGLLVLCLAGLYNMNRQGYSLGEMGRHFEETDLFFITADDIIRSKTAYSQDQELFEQDGSFNDSRTIDIRQYVTGQLDEASSNLNTSYTIRNLIAFDKDGRERMERLISRLISTYGSAEDQIGQQLLQTEGKYETVDTVSGVRLVDYATLNVDPASTIIEYYEDLCDTARSVVQRYDQYRQDHSAENSENSPDAPGNIYYYIENTSTKQHYTNMDVSSYASARAAVREKESLTFLFAGERKFNIMTADNDYVLNEKAGQFFIKNRFVGSNEKVLIAFDPDFPVGDKLNSAWKNMRTIRPRVMGAMGAGIACAVCLVILLSVSACTTGRPEKNGQVQLTRFDQIPTEIAAGLMLIFLTCLFLICPYILRKISIDSGYFAWVASAFGILIYMTAFHALMSLLRRHKAHTLWSNSVISEVLLGTAQVYNARKRSQRLLGGFTAFVILNIIFVSSLHVPGMIMAIVMDLAVLLYLMRDAVGDENVREGLNQISRGKLDYRINADVLTGSSREMAIAVNEMGDGLQKAVEDMLKNERLRAELITNVSHDLKTPLTSIINYVDLMKRENIPNEKAQEYIRVLDSKSQRLKILTEDLIEISKISSGNVEAHPVKMQLQMFLQQACGEFEDRLEEKKLKLKMELEKTPVWIMADGGLLWRVFENLLSNIAKYAREGSTVYAIVKREENGQVEIVFRNLPASPIKATAQQLQERFVRGDESRSQEGSGLGLSIAKSLTELMGGKFHIEVQEQLFEAFAQFPEIGK